ETTGCSLALLSFVAYQVFVMWMQDFLVASTGASSGEQHRFQDVLPLPRAGGPAPIQPLSCVSPKI
ncbi:hypothetical protein, partial [Faecalibaculum rodentium]|uniref:hypothetical protein n=1 Tax=Faecalibaculum rodentium TaxID=1702221 RepID=UPI002730B965